MIMKLIELEISFEGMGRRQNVQKKIDSILKQDWGTFEEIQKKHAGIQKKNQFDVLLSEKQNIENSLKELSNDIEKLEQVLAHVTSKEVNE